jgi:hypothetical protein
MAAPSAQPSFTGVIMFWAGWIFSEFETVM